MLFAFTRTCLFIFLLLVGFGCAEPAPPPQTGTEDPLPVETPPTNTLVDVILADDNFSTFSGALQAANLSETLSGPGPFTIFVPTNEAFAALPDGTLENLLAPENTEHLMSLILFHVANGRILATDVERMGAVETAFGESLPVVTSSTNPVEVGDAQIISTDMETDNGVIHVINRVLLPASLPI